MQLYKKFYTKREAKNMLESQSNEFAIIENPEFIHPNYEILPMAFKLNAPLNDLKAVLMDMDGTTTSMENLSIYSLEFMIRKMSGKIKQEDWRGLDQMIDYPNIIGNSTTKHVEYLVIKYSGFFDYKKIIEIFIYSSLWILSLSKNDRIKEEVKLNLTHFNLHNIIPSIDPNKNLLIETKEIISRSNIGFSKLSNRDLVKIGVVIFYQKYHELLDRIEKGESNNLSDELLSNTNNQLIDPAPNVFILLALIKGWLGEEIKTLIPRLVSDYEKKSGVKFQGNLSLVEENLLSLSRKFEQNSLKIALVTSSTSYEVNIIMKEVFRKICLEIDNYNLSERKKEFLKKKFSDFNNIYNSIVTANDSNEIRLKPHRDLYSIALNTLGISKNFFDQVIGFEDSESGTIAIRAAGVGMCIAVPLAETAGHNFEAATYICKAGFAQVLLDYNLFI